MRCALQVEGVGVTQTFKAAFFRRLYFIIIPVSQEPAKRQTLFAPVPRSLCDRALINYHFTIIGKAVGFNNRNLSRQLCKIFHTLLEHFNET